MFAVLLKEEQRIALKAFCSGHIFFSALLLTGFDMSLVKHYG